MILCCVESFDKNWIFYDFFKVVPKYGQRPCTIVQGHWPNFNKNGKVRILRFYYIF